MPDKARVRVAIADEDETINITYNVGKYEFFASDPNLLKNAYGVIGNAILNSDGTPAISGQTTSAGSGVQFKSRSAIALFSNTLTPDPTKDQNWTFLPFGTTPMSSGPPKQVKFETQDDNIQKAGSAWQTQKFHEYRWWYNNKASVLVTSCMGAGLGVSYSPRMSWMAPAGLLGDNTAVGVTGYERWFCFEDLPHNEVIPLRDINLAEEVGNFDIPTSIYTTTFRYAASYQVSTYANFRRGAAQRVLVGTSYVWYFISSDRYGNFTAYRATDYGSNFYNIPSVKKQYAAPSYPAWVTPYTDPNPATEWWSFTFNKDGTKAVSTPFEQVDAYAWIASENFETTSGHTDFPPRSPCMLDYGFAGLTRYPSAGVLWPKTSEIAAMAAANPATAPWDAHYVVERVRMYRHKKTPGDSAMHIQGTFYRLSEGRAYADIPSGYTLQSAATSTVDYEPAQLTIPGFVELGITITPNDPLDPDNFTLAVTVLQSERYSDNKRFYVDCGYYAVNKRTGKLASMPEDDTLLTAELEVYVKEPNKVVRDQASYDDGASGDIAPLDRYGYITKTVGGNKVQAVPNNSYNSALPPSFANSYNAQYANEPNCEGLMIANLSGDVEVYYVVRRRDTQAEVFRMCLAHNIRRSGLYTNVAGHNFVTGTVTGPAHLTAIRYGDIRSLNYLTMTSSLRVGTFTADIYNDYHPASWHPRYELRILGEKIRTINYAKDAVHGFAADEDPAITQANPRGDYTKLPTAAYVAPVNAETHGTNCPDSFLLATQIWAREALMTQSVTQHISTHPDGHWAFYQNTAGTGRTYNPNFSTEKTTTFDIIKPAKGHSSTHKDTFNKAFGLERDYSTYTANLLDYGGFCIGALWTELDPYSESKP